MGLTFLPRPQPQPRKRSRAIADIDGEHSCLQKKKRRLRLFLITSRLSPQFSHPATNIVDRGSSKIAVWAKQKSLGRNLLRKAAILNHIRRGVISAEERGVQPRQVLVEQEREQNELALAKLEFNYGSIDTYTRPVTSHYRSPNEAFASLLPRAQVPRKDYLPLPPSPLGLSNYDAFDADDDPYSHLDDDDDESSVNLFDEDEDADSVPFSPSAVAETSISSHTGASHLLNTPLLLVPPDLDILDHSEPVFGDYDQVDGGEHAAWPSNSAETTTRLPRPLRNRTREANRLLRDITQFSTRHIEEPVIAYFQTGLEVAELLKCCTVVAEFCAYVAIGLCITKLCSRGCVTEFYFHGSVAEFHFYSYVAQLWRCGGIAEPHRTGHSYTHATANVDAIGTSTRVHTQRCQCSAKTEEKSQFL
ncbi:hypothetical protein SNOG_10108 [Parastagonospora nodorum SN15]|uniref:Uncharacterized protein n=1 Tax=Phaeosphaeria nodorum (strain SN15 / ATCC MYA-4574 / FGSC 10173) TaxID=321614 RepID=Q0UDQ6_PHANO|nr:hypothetical protein SNOG_10108 [Parastagonospora nodorum SN15]EAT82443.2 hypothetical protein SNOG_10108 [Parastagonospora nodorum SN15]